ncbi:protein-disulfide reductase DsbD domain-containing protein [Lutibaculum baratangense]|uniref:Thiol:disulfide interchange protein DsbD N-terminal domain-containing protein n=1 Tax=Lutibaculum baratangense AMV1 TaxID=631454 RepID=V4QYX3_9HYPH|nr:protein-disulfide reductase DsbD domain-containing protein [Lutibaculum baratangense]ESR24927.1 hypothetical protein N177_2250 [Lutibaculum baratangense AMV1]
MRGFTSGAGILGTALLALSPAAGAQGLVVPEFDVSLISGGRHEDGRYLAAIRIDLPEGWKTYWRNPGDSGIPPSFDWSGSENLADVEVVWPAPELFDDGYGWVIGYDQRLVLPVRLTAEDPSKAVSVDLDLSYAVCREICVPEEARLGAVVDETGEARAEVVRALEEAPQRVERADPYGVVDASLAQRDGSQVLVVRVRFPESAGEPRLLVEGPAEWYLPVPERVQAGGDGQETFEVALPDDAEVREAAFVATGLSRSFSFEQPFRVD